MSIESINTEDRIFNPSEEIIKNANISGMDNYRSILNYEVLLVPKVFKENFLKTLTLRDLIVSEPEEMKEEVTKKYESAITFPWCSIRLDKKDWGVHDKSKMLSSQLCWTVTEIFKGHTHLLGTNSQKIFWSSTIILQQLTY